MFTPGETALHSFYIPFKKSEINEMIVSYKQHDDIILEVPIASYLIRDIYDESHTFLGSVFDIDMTQPQSLMFQNHDCRCGANEYYIQINVLLTSGARFTSKPIKSTNGIQFYKEVMGNG